MAIIGISFPFSRSSQSFPAKSTDADVVADNIRRILGTYVGSRVMRPTVGCRVLAYVFNSTGPVLNAQIINEVGRAIAEGEPRARVLDISVSEEGALGSSDRHVVVNVVYEVNTRIGSVSVTY